MVKFCLNCGEEIISLNPNRKFCCKECGSKFRSEWRPRTIENSFAIFKRLVANSANAEEFKKGYLQIFQRKEIEL